MPRAGPEIVRRHVGHICRVCRAETAGEQIEDTFQPNNDNGPRIPGGGEWAVPTLVGVDGYLLRSRIPRLRHQVDVDGLHTGSTTDGDTSTLTVLRHSSPFASSEVGWRISSSLTMPSTYRRSPTGYLKEARPSG